MLSKDRKLLGESIMWKRKDLKNKAKVTIKKNYWTAVVICFLVTILTGEFGNSITGIWQNEDSILPNYVLTENNLLMKEKVEQSQLVRAQEINDKIENIKRSLNDGQLKALNAINANINSLTKPAKYVYRIWDAIELFYVNQSLLGVVYVIAAIIAMLYAILIAEPLIVAERRFFIVARKQENTRLGEIKEVFRRKSWSNVAKIMLLKTIYNVLWFLTIVGGFIKIYEYRMIPYLLAENPKIDKKEAFKKSKEMMKGNKWKAFILDLSFILWDILAVFTFGLLNIVYVNPYKIATSVELYETLKEENDGQQKSEEN